MVPGAFQTPPHELLRYLGGQENLDRVCVCVCRRREVKPPWSSPSSAYRKKERPSTPSKMGLRKKSPSPRNARAPPDIARRQPCISDPCAISILNYGETCSGMQEEVDLSPPCSA